MHGPVRYRIISHFDGDKFRGLTSGRVLKSGASDLRPTTTGLTSAPGRTGVMLDLARSLAAESERLPVLVIWPQVEQTRSDKSPV